MTHIAIADCCALRVAVAASRIPGRAWGEIADLSRVLQEAKTILAEAQEAAKSIRERAHAEGYAQGAAKAQALSARHMVEAQRVALGFAEASQQRIVALSLGILARVAPRFGQNELVPALLHEALKAATTEHPLSVYVAPEAMDATRAMLAEWQREHALTEAPRVIEDPGIEPFGCIVESALGRIDAGLGTQLAAVRDILDTAAGSSGK
jgi:flagellar biosynthesis/type III secretory pathway protein FliH